MFKFFKEFKFTLEQRVVADAVVAIACIVTAFLYSLKVGVIVYLFWFMLNIVWLTQGVMGRLDWSDFDDDDDEKDQ